MTAKQLFKEIYREFPRIVTALISCAIAAVVILVSLVVNEIVISIQEGQAKQARIDMYDQAKLREISKAQDAEQWANDCRAANRLGDDTPANSCDVIQSGTNQEVQQEVNREVKLEGELVNVKPGGYMNWNVNANGEAQAPMIRGINTSLVGQVCTYCLDQYLQASGFDKRFNLTEGYGATLFKKVGDRYGIKPEVLVCIAQADTSLGKHIKTTFNIGNVGNNDRGHTRGFTSIGAGIDAIGKVLTGRYLAHKQSLGSLTPFGGGSSPFYATSPTGNWYNNVRNCLAEITQDENVGPDFMIRK